MQPTNFGCFQLSSGNPNHLLMSWEDAYRIVSPTIVMSIWGDWRLTTAEYINCPDHPSSHWSSLALCDVSSWVESTLLFRTWWRKQIKLSKCHLILNIRNIIDIMKLNHYVINNRSFLKILRIIAIIIIIVVVNIIGRSGFKGGRLPGWSPSGLPQNGNGIHIFYWDIYFSRITKS
jgi:hypothetical protein